MKNKTKLTFAAISIAMLMSAIPLMANGNKDREELDESIPESSILKIDGTPARFGEGGGKGAGLRPECFKEIPEGIISGEAPRTVSAQLTTITGTLKVKGGKGNRKFTFACDNGKIYSMNVDESHAEHLAGFKDKNAKAEGVFYGKDFLLFDFIPIE